MRLMINIIMLSKIKKMLPYIYIHYICSSKAKKKIECMWGRVDPASTIGFVSAMAGRGKVTAFAFTDSS